MSTGYSFGKQAEEPPYDPPRDVQDRRLDGPIFEQFVAAGYRPENYPPPDYAALDSPGYAEFLSRPAAPSAPLPDAGGAPPLVEGADGQKPSAAPSDPPSDVSSR